MNPIIYRNIKASRLTSSEVDANFTSIENAVEQLESDGANVIAFNGDDVAPAGSLGEALGEALAAISTLQGTSAQVLVDSATVGDVTTLTISLPSNVTFPGTAAARGSIDGTSAAAGFVGEYKETILGLGSAVALTDVTVANVLTLSLGAGDWDVGGVVSFTGSATTTGYLMGGASLVTAQLPNAEFIASVRNGGTAPFGIDPRMALPPRRVVVTSTTIVYLVVKANFSSGTCSAYGKLCARRIR